MKKISTAKAANMLGVSRWTLRRWGDKKLIPFVMSRSGYRYYKEEDLIALKEKHTIVHVVEKKPKIVIEKRDETLLLPAAPVPISEARSIHTVLKSADQPTKDVKNLEAVSPPKDTPAKLVVPAIPSPPAPGKQSFFSTLWKILPFTVIIGFLFCVSVPSHSKEIGKTQGTGSVFSKNSSSVFPLLSFRDVVLAAATDSSELSGNSVQFFLSQDATSVDAMLSTNRSTPESGNTIYLSSMTDFSSFNDSPFAYLNGSHGTAGPVAIIDNADALRSHPFFANVQNGDKLLMYKEAQKAVLFRPTTNEVIAFAPLDAVPATSYEQIEGQPVVDLRNGMGTPYDMKTFEAELAYYEQESVVVGNENASKSDYKKSIIVDVTGMKKGEAQALAYKLRLTLSDLPAGEYRPPAGVDYLIILGKDRLSTLNYIAPSSTASATPKAQ